MAPVNNKFTTCVSIIREFCKTNYNTFASFPSPRFPYQSVHFLALTFKEVVSCWWLQSLANKVWYVNKIHLLKQSSPYILENALLVAVMIIKLVAPHHLKEFRWDSPTRSSSHTWVITYLISNSVCFCLFPNVIQLDSCIASLFLCITELHLRTGIYNKYLGWVLLGDHE